MDVCLSCRSDHVPFRSNSARRRDSTTHVRLPYDLEIDSNTCRGAWYNIPSQPACPDVACMFDGQVPCRRSKEFRADPARKFWLYLRPSARSGGFPRRGTPCKCEAVGLETSDTPPKGALCGSPVVFTHPGVPLCRKMRRAGTDVQHRCMITLHSTKKALHLQCSLSSSSLRTADTTLSVKKL